MFHFSDLKKEKQIDFISKNLSEILFKQRHELNLSQEQFLKNSLIIISILKNLVIYPYHN